MALVNAASLTAQEGTDRRGGHLRVDAQHEDVLPQVARPHHLHDASLLRLLLQGSLQLCRHRHNTRRQQTQLTLYGKERSEPIHILFVRCDTKNLVFILFEKD